MPAKAKEAPAKVKAEKVDINQLIVLSAYKKVFTSGKTGFFGQVQDPQTGDSYQIVGAVKIISKN